MYLNAHGARRVISRSHLVQAQHFSRRVVEFVMVDLDVGQRCVELHVDVALPRRELECRHGGGASGVFPKGGSLVAEEYERTEDDMSGEIRGCTPEA
jgi:hypothetical protein